MNPLLGIRMAFAGGRESAARMALMAVSVAIGVAMILASCTALPVMQAHIDRLAWHRTTAASPATAPDKAMWLAVTDRYAGRDIIRVHVAALGPQPPKPPGVQRLPGPGELVVSPALAELLRHAAADQLGDRFPGRVVGIIGPQGLIAAEELVGIIGHDPQELRDVAGAVEIRGVQQPGEKLDLAAFWQIFFWIIAVLLVGPVVVFISMATRIGGARRERRLAAFRLAGATRLQTATLAAAETALAAVSGTLLGWLGYHAARPLIARYLTLGHDMPLFVQDVVAPANQVAFVLIAVPLLAVLTTLVSLRPVQIRPLDTRQRVPRKPPTARRLIPIAIGFFLIWASGRAANSTEYADAGWTGPLTMLATLCVVVGLFLTGAWVCMWISRALARLSSTATMLIVARRIAADPFSTFRSVSGAALAMYVATSLGLVAAHERGADVETRSMLRVGVVEVHAQGASPEALAPLLAKPGVVVARNSGPALVVVSCSELATVAEVSCPLPRRLENEPVGNLFRVPDLFSPSGFAEPAPGDPVLPIRTIFIPTDGTLAAEERVRTEVALAVPGARSETERDHAAHAGSQIGVWESLLPAATVFVLLIAACSLTVAAVTGVMERRRPFALLRASGVRLGELQRIVLMEIALPLVLTVAAGVGAAFLATYAAVPVEQWVLPRGDFLAGLAVGMVAALAVTVVSLPLMEVATRHDSVRYE